MDTPKGDQATILALIRRIRRHQQELYRQGQYRESDTVWSLANLLEQEYDFGDAHKLEPPPIDPPDSATPLQELKECYDLVLKSARRAARDLKHAIDNIGDPSLKPHFYDRYAHYKLVFGGTSEYRADLYADMNRREHKLEARIRELEEQLQSEMNRTPEPADPDQAKFPF